MERQILASGPLTIALMAGSLLAGQIEVRTWTFDDDAPGEIARGFTGEVGEWKVVAVGKGKVLAQAAKNAGRTYNVALAAEPSVRDLDLSVRLKPVAGEEDQGGGLVWRARDGKNYYVARFNPLENNFRVYKVVDGQRTELQGAELKLDRDWHAVRVIMKGDHIRCFYDQNKYLDIHDKTFPDAGRIGVWTKADAQSHFDDLTLREP